MNYELAKELKEAGFPQRDRHFYFSEHTTPPTRWDINVIDAGQRVENEIAAPTLEELIEACGDQFRGLQRLENGKWYCTANALDWTENGIEVIESTPEEAVAKLWLALNTSNK